MIALENCLLSDDIVDKHFSCDINACKGACCVEGDAGAPLEDEEVGLIQQNLEFIISEMDEDGIKSLEHQGVAEKDIFDNLVTSCKPNKECTFATRKDGILQCAIEKANAKHQFGFPKPISCHLYPIRLSKYNDSYALNYHKWDICSAACSKGKKEEIRIFEFAKTALIRKFGEDWYNSLVKLVEESSKP